MLISAFMCVSGLESEAWSSLGDGTPEDCIRRVNGWLICCKSRGKQPRRHPSSESIYSRDRHGRGQDRILVSISRPPFPRQQAVKETYPLLNTAMTYQFRVPGQGRARHVANAPTRKKRLETRPDSDVTALDSKQERARALSPPLPLCTVTVLLACGKNKPHDGCDVKCAGIV